MMTYMLRLLECQLWKIVKKRRSDYKIQKNIDIVVGKADAVSDTIQNY